jgi:hypothetical protein
MEECSRYTGAYSILDAVICICSQLSYNAKTEEERNAIIAFQGPYAVLRFHLTMEDKDKIDWIYKEVQPLIFGTNPKLTLEYILQIQQRYE